MLRHAEADVIVRYQSHVLSARLAMVINPALEYDFGRLPRRNFISAGPVAGLRASRERIMLAIGPRVCDDRSCAAVGR